LAGQCAGGVPTVLSFKQEARVERGGGGKEEEGAGGGGGGVGGGGE